jgi:hypothetical protein
VKLSANAERLRPQLVVQPGGPNRLLAAWRSGQLLDTDLPTLIPDAWLSSDSPERVIGAEAWVELFDAAGFFVFPSTPAMLALQRMFPSDSPGEMTLFRGSTVERARGMSWVPAPKVAEPFRLRAEATVGSETAVFRARVASSGVLAIIFHALDTGGVEYVVNPAVLPEQLERAESQDWLGTPNP